MTLKRETKPTPGEKPGFLPQHRIPGTNDQYEVTEGSNGALHSKIVDQNGVPFDSTNPMPTQLTGSNMEYYGNSTDTKPFNSSVPIGATFFEIDTQEAYMNDGSAWVVLS